MASEELQLLREVKERLVDIAVFGSFNVNFPFFEQVILPALRGKGCHHQVLLMDAGKCAEVVGNTELGPQRAGHDYSLVPVRASGAFHPKFMLLLGRLQSRVLIGSHNLTLSGFGLNREVTNRIVIRPDDGSQALGAAVFQFARSWTAAAAPDLVELMDACAVRTPWLTKPQEGPPDCAVLATFPDGPPLWAQLRPRLPAAVRRVAVLGPYFDHELRFLKELAETLSPDDLVVAVSPEQSQITAKAERLIPGARWVDLSGWCGDAHRLVHAKVLLIELREGTSVLVTGSANPSAPAWLGEPGARNAELVVVRHLAAGDPTPEQLGLDALTRLPPMTAEAWARVAARQVPIPAVASGDRVWVAVEEKEGFRVDAECLGDAREVILLQADGVELGRIRTQECTGPVPVVPVADRDVRRATARLCVENRRRLAIVHHLHELRDLATDEKARSLRSALLDLSSAESGIERLIATVEKAIFDGVRQSTKAKKGAASPATVPSSGDKGSMTAVSVGPLPATSRKRMRMASGDLAMILDALLHSLGDTPLADREAGDSMTREERLAEEGIPMTDNEEHPSDEHRPVEEDDPQAPEVDGVMKASLCQRKTRILMRRMLNCLDEARVSGDCAHVVVQLAATLGLLRKLRARESSLPWLPRGAELIDSGCQWDFFKAGVRLMFLPGGVAEASVAEVGNVFSELGDCAALLAWSAFHAGLGRSSALHPREYATGEELGDVGRAADQRERVRENLIGIAMLLRCLDQVMPEPTELHTLLGEEAFAWLAEHRNWFLRLSAEMPPIAVAPVPGAVVRWGLHQSPMLSVMVNVDGDKAHVVDLTGPQTGVKPGKAPHGGATGSQPTKVFKASYLKVVGLVDA